MKIAIEISGVEPSQHYSGDEMVELGALDYDVTLRLGGKVIVGSVTLCADRVNGRMGIGRAPFDGFFGESLVAAINALPISGPCRRRLYDEIEDLVTAGRRRISEIEIEVE